ncbi:MAG: hypothetical protein GEU87_02410 [Alphaproteobacteria bacterium]|nr:hypothetical protein [Alphaproteobacteria bacterium]
MDQRTHLKGRLRDAETACAWESHRLSFGFDGPPEWCEARRKLMQKSVAHYRVNIATLRAKQSAMEPFGESSGLPKFLRGYSAAAE